MRKLLLVLILLISATLFSCELLPSNNNDKTIDNIEIKKDNVEIETLNVFVGDSFSLTIDGVDKSNISWSSSNSSIVNIKNDGNAVVLSKGLAIITASLKDAPFLFIAFSFVARTARPPRQKAQRHIRAPQKNEGICPKNLH